MALTQGDSGAAVERFQWALIRWDGNCLIPDLPDGNYRPTTSSAVVRFQEDYGLPLTGEIDGVTAALLLSL